MEPSNSELLAFLQGLTPNKLREYNIRIAGVPVTRKLGQRRAMNVLQSNRNAIVRRLLAQPPRNSALAPRQGRPPIRFVQNLGGAVAYQAGRAARTAGRVGTVAGVLTSGLKSYVTSGKGVMYAAKTSWDALPLSERRNIVNKAVNYAKGNILKTNISMNKLKNSIKIYMNKPTYLQANRIKNNGINFMKNYVTSQLGFQNMANRNKVHQLIQKLIIISDKAATGTPNAKRYYGEQLGNLIAEVITAYASLGGPRGKYSNISNGIKKGVLDVFVGETVSAAVRRLIVAKGRYPTVSQVISELGGGAAAAAPSVMNLSRKAGNINYTLNPSMWSSAKRLATSVGGFAADKTLRRIAPLPEERKMKPENYYIT